MHNGQWGHPQFNNLIFGVGEVDIGVAHQTASFAGQFRDCLARYLQALGDLALVRPGSEVPQ